MLNPAALSHRTIELPESQIHTAVVLDDAEGVDQEVRCELTDSDVGSIASDPMAWTPFVKGSGLFYPKQGDRAVLGLPIDGPPVVLAWWPNAAEPDHPFS